MLSAGPRTSYSASQPDSFLLLLPHNTVQIQLSLLARNCYTARCIRFVTSLRLDFYRFPPLDLRYRLLHQ